MYDDKQFGIAKWLDGTSVTIICKTGINDNCGLRKDDVDDDVCQSFLQSDLSSGRARHVVSRLRISSFYLLARRMDFR